MDHEPLQQTPSIEWLSSKAGLLSGLNPECMYETKHWALVPLAWLAQDGWRAPIPFLIFVQLLAQRLVHELGALRSVHGRVAVRRC